MTISAKEYAALKRDIATSVGVPVEHVNMLDNPGLNTPYAFTKPWIRVWLPKWIDLDTHRGRVKDMCSFWANEYAVTVDHDPDSVGAPVANTATCATQGCPTTNDYDAPSNRPDGRWTCGGCRLWSHVAGHTPAKVAEVATDVQTSAPLPEKGSVVYLICNGRESAMERLSRWMLRTGFEREGMVRSTPCCKFIYETLHPCGARQTVRVYWKSDAEKYDIVETPGAE